MDGTRSRETNSKRNMNRNRGRNTRMNRNKALRAVARYHTCLPDLQSHNLQGQEKERIGYNRLITDDFSQN